MDRWIDGESVTRDNVDLNEFAKDLAKFLIEFQSIDASEGPVAGAHNFYRGGDLLVYNEETQGALTTLSPEIDIDKCRHLWDTALSTSWMDRPVWIHGDIAQGNLITTNGRLSGVIDFGCMGTGDPACDLVMAWTFFDENSRKIFIENMKLDKNTWDRARGWALWKALITYENKMSRKVIETLLNEM